MIHDPVQYRNLVTTRLQELYSEAEQARIRGVQPRHRRNVVRGMANSLGVLLGTLGTWLERIAQRDAPVVVSEW